jgi:hypothetical protein
MIYDVEMKKKKEKEIEEYDVLERTEKDKEKEKFICYEENDNREKRMFRVEGVDKQKGKRQSEDLGLSTQF